MNTIKDRQAKIKSIIQAIENTGNHSIPLTNQLKSEIQRLFEELEEEAKKPPYGPTLVTGYSLPLSPELKCYPFNPDKEETKE